MDKILLHSSTYPKNKKTRFQFAEVKGGTISKVLFKFDVVYALLQKCW